MLVSEAFDAECELDAFLEQNDIARRYFPYLKAVILTAFAEPETALPKAYARMAAQMQISPHRAKRIVRNAVYLGWEHASSPVSLMFAKRLSPEMFIEHAVQWLQNRKKASENKK